MRPAVHLILGLVLGWILASLWHLVTKDGWGEGAGLTQPVMSSITSSSSSPFDVIYDFYKAVEEGDEGRIQELVIPELWSHLKEDGFLDQWRARKNMEPKLRFVLFLVADQHVDEEAGRAWARGQAEWDRPHKGIISFEETITLVRVEETWKIAAMESESPVYTVDEFYRAIQRGDLTRMRSLLDPAYWMQLEAAGVISALKKDYKASAGEIYLVFYIRDYGLVDKDNAWVKGDVIWHPLSPQSRETPVILNLMKTAKGWKIAQITGHWEIRK